MDFIIDAIVEWLKGLLVDGIMGNLDGLFDNVNQSVGEIATQVGTTPADWNAGVFSMIRQISETAILPIAGVILTFVMTYELIQMLIERNNLHTLHVCLAHQLESWTLLHFRCPHNGHLLFLFRYRQWVVSIDAMKREYGQTVR